MVIKVLVQEKAKWIYILRRVNKYCFIKKDINYFDLEHYYFGDRKGDSKNSLTE